MATENSQDTKKERKSLGIIIPNENKASEKSYDLKGTIEAPDGTKLRIGGYKATSSGKGKLPEGATYYWLHRVEKLDLLIQEEVPAIENFPQYQQFRY